MRSAIAAVALLLSAPAVATEPATDANLDDFKGTMVAVGGGPEWKLMIYPDNPMFFSAEGEGSQVESPVVKPAVMGRGIVQFSSKSITAAFKRTDACKVEGKDLVYPFETAITIKTKTYKGCGYAQWANHLEAMIPAIDACMKAAKSKDPVTLAVRESDGIMVRLATRDYTTTLCQVDDSSGSPQVVKTLVDKNIAAAVGERDPLFYRAPAKNPGGECYEATKAKDKTGKFLGWLDTDEGC